MLALIRDNCIEELTDLVFNRIDNKSLDTLLKSYVKIKMCAGVTVRHTQRIGEILMNKKLVAIMTFVIITLGATMMISSHKIEIEKPGESMVLASLSLPQFEQKDSVSYKMVTESIKTEELLTIEKDQQTSSHVFTINDDQSENEPVLQPLTTTPTGGSGLESEDGFIPYVEQLIFDKVNQERAKENVPSLENNQTMNQYARTKSQDMGDRNYFSHENPEGDLMNAFMQQDGVYYQAWGENIAYIGGDTNENLEEVAEQFMSNWMNSSGHRENILSTNFSSIGIGVYRVGNKIYATQEFYR